MKSSFLSCLLIAILAFSQITSPPFAAAQVLQPAGVVDIEKLVKDIDLGTFSGKRKTPSTEQAMREHLLKAGWVPNDSGDFLVQLSNIMLSFRTVPELDSVYIMPFTRNVIPGSRPRPIKTGSYVVVREDLEAHNYNKISGFGYIGRGSHVKGDRYGLLPFNSGFTRLLSSGAITTYVFTLDQVDAEVAKRERKEYELYFRCRFTEETSDYLRLQSNIKLSSAESTNSRNINEYLLCVDVVGAFLFNAQNGEIVREWRID